MKELLYNGVRPENIILLNLFCTEMSTFALACFCLLQVSCLEHVEFRTNLVNPHMTVSVLGTKHIRERYPDAKIITSEISSSIPQYFGTKYFGTD